MKKWGLTISILVLLGFIWQTAEADEIVCSFSLDSLEIEDSYNYRYPGLENINVNSQLSIPVKTIYFESVFELSDEDIFVDSYDQEFIGYMSPDKIKFEDQITGYADIDLEVIQNNKTLHSPIYNIGNIIKNGVSYTVVSLLPITIDVDNNVIFNKNIRIKESVTGQIYEKSKISIGNLQSLSIYFNL